MSIESGNIRDLGIIKQVATEVASLISVSNTIIIKECINCVDYIIPRGDKVKLILKAPCTRSAEDIAGVIAASWAFRGRLRATRAIGVTVAALIPLAVVAAASLAAGAEAIAAIATGLGGLASIADYALSRRMGRDFVLEKARLTRPPQLLVEELEAILRAHCSSCRDRPSGYLCERRGATTILSRS